MNAFETNTFGPLAGLTIPPKPRSTPGYDTKVLSGDEQTITADNSPVVPVVSSPAADQTPVAGVASTSPAISPAIKGLSPSTTIIGVGPGETATGPAAGISITPANMGENLDSKLQRGVQANTPDNMPDVATYARELSAGGTDISKAPGTIPSVVMHQGLTPLASQNVSDRVDMSTGSPRANAMTLNAGLALPQANPAGQVTADALAQRDAYQQWRQNTPEGRLQANNELLALHQQTLSDPSTYGNDYNGGAKIAAAQAATHGLTEQNKQLQTGVIAAEAVAARKEGNQLALQGHIITAKERADAIKEAARLTADSRKEAAAALAESRVFAAGAKGGLTNQEDLRARRDIAVRLRDSQRAYVQALKLNDPDKIASAVDTIEAMNADAELLGVTKLPVPKRPQTSEQTALLEERALANLNAKRGPVGKFFNSSPNAAELQAEVDRVKRVGTAAPAMDTMPPAADHAGRIVRDTVTGKRLKSNGSVWEVQP